MSVDKSLRSKTVLKRPRSVMSRIERLQVLEEDGRWKDGESVFGLPKVRTFRPKRRKHAAAKKEEAKAEATEQGAAPAGPGAGAKA